VVVVVRCVHAQRGPQRAKDFAQGKIYNFGNIFPHSKILDFACGENSKFPY
jgi:hypothetical protein